MYTSSIILLEHNIAQASNYKLSCTLSCIVNIMITAESNLNLYKHVHGNVEFIQMRGCMLVNRMTCRVMNALSICMQLL